MSSNRFQFHLQVLPEDDANREIANGFLLHSTLRQRPIQVLHPAGGWMRVLESFEREHIDNLTRNTYRNLLMLIDFDSDPTRLELVNARVPTQIKNRVFVLGIWSEPEALKADYRNYETIGTLLADGFFNQDDLIWEHPLLKYNADERRRTRESVCPSLQVKAG